MSLAVTEVLSGGLFKGASAVQAAGAPVTSV